MNQTAMMGWGPAWGPGFYGASMVEVGGNDHFLTRPGKTPNLDRIAKVLEGKIA